MHELIHEQRYESSRTNGCIQLQRGDDDKWPFKIADGINKLDREDKQRVLRVT